jgi:NAD(P)-dependent dehydrogenase (short-subunit alcohol dehydrogenase family)
MILITDQAVKGRKRMGALEGKVAIITGGASGIGLGTVELFVAQGARVVVADLLADKGKALEARHGDRLVFKATDVANEDQVKALIDGTVDRFGRVDCLFNNAGVAGPICSITELSMADYSRSMDILLRGVLLGIKHAGRHMMAQKSGSIINTASMAALIPGSYHVYNIAKAGVVMLTRSAALELGNYGVRVNCVCPGPIVTPLFGLTAGLTREESEKKMPTVEKNIAIGQPIKRAGMPDDVAQAVAWFASDASSFVTGQILAVDGGRSVGRPWSGDPAAVVKQIVEIAG